jgi:hypothetical protein
MSLRRAGGTTVRLLRVYASQGLVQHGELRVLQLALPASQQLLAAAGWDAHSSSSSNSWWAQHLSQQQLQALRQLATQPDKKEEQQPKKDSSSSSPVPLPDAEDCDEAIEHYARARSSYQRLAPPSTYKTASQRVVDILGAGLKGSVALLGWVVRLPVKLARLATWSRDDWSAWWAKAKKTVKEEAHHYWVSVVVQQAGAGGLMLRAKLVMQCCLQAKLVLQLVPALQVVQADSKLQLVVQSYCAVY